MNAILRALGYILKPTEANPNEDEWLRQIEAERIAKEQQEAAEKLQQQQNQDSLDSGNSHEPPPEIQNIVPQSDDDSDFQDNFDMFDGIQ